MAQYTIAHPCGHTYKHRLFGPLDNRERALALESTEPCPDCRKAARKAERQEAHRYAVEAQPQIGLPDLEGTDKQIAWAVDIRQRVVDSALDHISGERLTITWAYIAAALGLPTYASWWIEHRHRGNHYKNLLRVIERQYPRQCAMILGRLAAENPNDPHIRITTDNSESSLGQPVLVTLGHTYGPGDTLGRMSVADILDAWEQARK